jgi:plastocyanin domain-containing protein
MADMLRRRGTAGASQEALIVVRGGYHPGVVKARAGTPVRLRFRREESLACSDTVLLPQLGRFADLPEGETVAIDCGPLDPGDYEFSCARGALHGTLVVR